MAGRIAYLGNIVTDGLILDLDAAKQESFNLTGSTWNDLSGKQNNSTLVRTSFITGSGPEAAISFITGSMYVAATNTSAALVNNQFAWDPSGSLGSSAITIEMWFKSFQNTGCYLLSKPWNGSGDYNYNIQLFGSSSFSMFLKLSNAASRTINNVPITDGTWKQFVYWISPTQAGYYINGTQYSDTFTHNVTGSIPSLGNANLALALMTLYPYPGGANPSFSVTGSLANVKFYNRQLTQAEVVQNFNAYRTRYGI